MKLYICLYAVTSMGRLCFWQYTFVCISVTSTRSSCFNSVHLSLCLLPPWGGLVLAVYICLYVCYLHGKVMFLAVYICLYVCYLHDKVMFWQYTFVCMSLTYMRRLCFGSIHLSVCLLPPQGVNILTVHICLYVCYLHKEVMFLALHICLYVCYLHKEVMFLALCICLCACYLYKEVMFLTVCICLCAYYLHKEVTSLPACICLWACYLHKEVMFLAVCICLCACYLHKEVMFLALCICLCACYLHKDIVFSAVCICLSIISARRLYSWWHMFVYLLYNSESYGRVLDEIFQ